MKTTQFTRIADKAYNLAYAQSKLIERDDIDWMVFHGITDALEQFALMLIARKACAQWEDALLRLKVRMLDCRCAMDEDSKFYSPKHAKAINDYTMHVFYRIARKEALNEDYTDVLFEEMQRHDPTYVAA